ncbi:hypothetical protein L596_000369 [Steinernema carpocapsae]|uniref:Uncharacterized protein n=1 Tax=Steinernema carpocapsae TaxID=34508 RepID=A0A4U8UI59_STECR|nr:hypothetical protein L596_000369 [Steinernema carpocapsae]
MVLFFLCLIWWVGCFLRSWFAILYVCMEWTFTTEDVFRFLTCRRRRRHRSLADFLEMMEAEAIVLSDTPIRELTTEERKRFLTSGRHKPYKLHFIVSGRFD